MLWHFVANARLPFIKNRTKKKRLSIGNSYNSIQNVLQINTIISILLPVAKKIILIINFLWQCTLVNHPGMRTILICQEKWSPLMTSATAGINFAINKLSASNFGSGLLRFSSRAYFANFYNTGQLLLTNICILLLLFFKFKSYLSP